jgi:glycosyltransferase involved in cell wall biosynthesis
MRRKMMLTIHNSRPQGIAPDVDFWGGIWDDTLGRVTFSACDRINCVSRAALESTVPEGMRGKCAVVYNGVDTEAFAPGLGQGEVRKGLGIPEGALLFMSNARLVTQKGFAFLLEAFAGVKEKERGAMLLIVGKGPLKGELLREAEALGIADSVKITTGIPERELPTYYNAADAFVLASLYEPSAVVLYEAMACGKPIVATSAGGNPEIVSGECGLIVPPRDSGALRDGMLALAGDDGLRRRMGAAARKRAVEEFDWDVAAKGWNASYKALF